MQRSAIGRRVNKAWKLRHRDDYLEGKRRYRGQRVTGLPIVPGATDMVDA